MLSATHISIRSVEVYYFGKEKHLTAVIRWILPGMLDICIRPINYLPDNEMVT